MFQNIQLSGSGPDNLENKPKISILYVDDEEDLLNIARIILEKTTEFSIDTKISAKEVLESDTIKSYDVIISDYQMPGIDGISFLKEVRRKYGDIPFILFTGRGREEVVIEAINNGADFYLQKGGEPIAQFAELAHKIRLAFKNKQAEKIISESQKMLSDIINFLPDATFAIDNSGVVIAWNRAIEDMTGISAENMIGKGNYEYAIPLYGIRRPVLIDLIGEPDEKVAEFYQDISRDGDALMATTDYLHPRQHRIYASGKVCRLYNQKGEVTGAIESIRDISGLKLTELELRNTETRLMNIVENFRDCMLIVDFDGVVRFINQTGVHMMDFEEKNSVIGHNVMEFIHPESRDLVLNDMKQVAEGKDAYLSQYHLVTLKSRDIYVESYGKKIQYQNSDVILVDLRVIVPNGMNIPVSIGE